MRVYSFSLLYTSNAFPIDLSDSLISAETFR